MIILSFVFSFLLDAGNGLAEVILVDPRGRQDVVPVSVKQTGPGRFRCEYVPREPGLHSVNVFFAGRPIPSSPYGVNVASCRSKNILNNLIYSIIHCYHQLLLKIDTHLLRKTTILR